MTGPANLSGERFGEFPTTNWSMIVQASNGSANAEHALTRFLRSYSPALRTYLLVTKRMGADDAEDLLQSFFLDKVICDEFLSRADRTRGKFRSFLLKVLNNFIISNFRYSHVKRRTPRGPTERLEATALLEGGGDPALEFEIACARQVITRAVDQMKEECRQTGRNKLWGVFEGRVLNPTIYALPEASYESLVARFAFSSSTEASNLLVTAKRTFARHLRAVVGEYALDQYEVEEEIADLFNIVSRPGA